MELLVDGYRASVCGNERFLETVMTVSQDCEYT